MKKFSQFINEGAINSYKENTAHIAYNNIYETQQVNEFLSVVAGCALLWAFTTFVTSGGKTTGTAAGGAAGGGLAAVLGMVVAKKIADKKAEKEEKKKKEEEEKKKKEEEEREEKQEKLNRLFICAKQQLNNVKDKDSQDYKDAMQFVNAYTQAKVGDNGKPIKDPDEITKRLKKIAGPELYATFEKRGKEAARNEEIEKMMKGLALEANKLTDEQIDNEIKTEQTDAASLAVMAAEKEISEIEEKYNKQIEEAEKKGDNSLIESLKAEKEAKLTIANDKLKQAQATQARVQKERELESQREVLKERQNQLATSQQELAELQRQKADAITAANGDENTIKDIENRYKSLIETAEKNVEAKQKAVDDTSKKISSLETELGSLATPGGTPTPQTPTPTQLAKEGEEIDKSDNELKDELKEYYSKEENKDKIPNELKKEDGSLDEEKLNNLNSKQLKTHATDAGIKTTKTVPQATTNKSDNELKDELKEYYSKEENKDKIPNELKKEDGSLDEEKLNNLNSKQLKTHATDAGIKTTKTISTTNIDDPLKKNEINFKDDNGIEWKKDGDKFYKKEGNDWKESTQEQFKSAWDDIHGEDEKNEGEDEDDKEVAADDDQTDVEEINGKKVHRNPAKIWHKKKKKSGKGSTKNYYDKDGNSISPEEFKEKMRKFQERKRKENSSLNSISRFQKFIFEKNRKSESNTLSNYLRNQMIR